MADIEHGTITPTDNPTGNRGNHIINGFDDVANDAAKTTLEGTLGATDEGRVVYQTDVGKFFIVNGGAFEPLVTGYPPINNFDDVADDSAKTTLEGTLTGADEGRVVYQTDVSKFFIVNGGAFEPLVTGYEFYKRYHTTTFSPLALYTLDNETYTDTSGNARHLTEVVTAPSTVGYMRGSTAPSGGRFERNDTSFELTGAVSVVALIKIDAALAVATPGAVIASYQGDGDAAAENALWSLCVSGQNLQWFSEHGAGVNDALTSTFKIPIGEWVHVAGTRDAAGTDVNLYVNGVNVGNATLTAPTGGTGSVDLTVMEFGFGTGSFDNAIASLAIYGSELSAANILALAQYTGRAD